MTAPEGFAFDERRVPHEIRRSMDRDFALIPEMVDPGLTSYPEPDGLRFTDRHRTTVAVVPWHRLARLDIDMLVAHLEEQEPCTDVDQALAAVRAGRVVDLPDSDEVAIEIREPYRTMLVHRAHCVPGWPPDDIEGGP